MELLERGALLGELLHASEAASQGHGRVVVIEGEAGVGKTSVLRAIASRPASGARVLWGACDALTTPRPLGPLRDMAGQGALATAERSAGGASTYDIFEAFLEDLRDPTIAIVEDVHWADEATLDMLRFVGRRVGATRSLVLVSLRTDEVDADHPLRAVLGDLATTGLLRRRLEPLSVDAVRQLASESPFDPDELHHVTGGNPFYVTEVLAAPSDAVPPTVRDAVLARVGRLSDASRDLVELASIEPGGMSRARLRSMGVEDRAVDDAVRASVLVDDGRVLRFRHELARRSIETILSAGRARELHRRVFAVLEADAVVDPALLAHHAASTGDHDAELHWSRVAGDAAMSASAHREAVAHYADAVRLEHLLSPTDAAGLFAAYAEALHSVDQVGKALESWQQSVARWERSDDVIGLWAARAQLARALWTAGRSAEGYALIDEAMAALTSLDAPDGRVADALGVGAYLAMLARRSDEAVTLARRAIEVATATGHRSALPVAYNALGAARICGFEDLGGLEDLERSGEIGAELGSRRSVAGRYTVAGSALGEIRRYERGIAELDEGIAYADAHDMDFARHYGVAWLARIRFELGQWDDAERLAADAIGGVDASPISSMVALVVQGRVRARRGIADARAPLDAAWEIATRTGDLQRTWPAIAGRAEVAWLEAWPADDRREVVDTLGSVLEQARALRLAWAIGELAFWLERLSGDQPDGSGSAPPYAASLAGDHLAAADLWTRIGCPYEAAWETAARDDEASLRDGLGALIALGADPLATMVRRRLRSMGARDVPAGPRRSTARSPLGLTSREAEVLELLARGLTDREIADELVVSTRTASHHVSAILGKLGVRRRSEAVAVARSSLASEGER